MFFSLLAAKRFQYRRFFTRALESAVEDRAWASVGACCHHLWEMDAWAGRGRLCSPAFPWLLMSLLASFMWPRRLDGLSSGLLSVWTLAGNILIDPEEIQQKVFVLY
jgi:hypothetical protein